MLQKETLAFLKALSKNNHKPWFDENRKKYETAKADFVALIDRLILEISTFDPSVSHLAGKACIFRINRDVRFSKNKAPYKTNLAASICSQGRQANFPGYYFHCEPGKSFLAGGFYMPLPEDLKKIRQELDYNFDDWKTILKEKSFKTNFPGGVEGTQSLARPPKSYDENNPAITFLKMKGFIVSKAIDDAELIDKGLVKKTVQSFKAMKPMIDFLKQGLDN